jgi:hypothetical protein
LLDSEKLDRPNNGPLMLGDFFSILLGACPILPS